MFRRSSAALFRRTAVNRSGELKHVITAEEAPAADVCKGLFGHLNGPAAILRVIDIKWILNRFVGLGREGYIASPILYGMVWYVFYGIQAGALYGDAKPPRSVDWNKERAGSLPESFEATKL